MRAAVLHRGAFTVEDVAPLVPAKGQLLLTVQACGICGSDLHARHQADELADDARDAGYDAFMRADQRVVLGHEFSGLVAEAGPGTRRRPGQRSETPVVAMPLFRAGAKEPVHLTGLTTEAPGGYAEQVLVQESLTFDVPNGLAASTAALTEPMGVALHAVRRSGVGKGQVAIVIGCGPIGLGVIAMLKATGVRTVVASDLSPARRALATTMGADVVVDPREDSPWEASGKTFMTMPRLFGLAVDTMEKLRAVPLLPWQHVFTLADKLGATPSGPVVFECVGVPGMIAQLAAAAPVATRIVVVGVCMGDDTFRPSGLINKEVDLRFVLGYTPAEFREALHLLADGTVDPTPLITGTVGLDGVAQAFDDLGDPETHAKILVDPRL